MVAAVPRAPRLRVPRPTLPRASTPPATGPGQVGAAPSLDSVTSRGASDPARAERLASADDPPSSARGGRSARRRDGGAARRLLQRAVEAASVCLAACVRAVGCRAAIAHLWDAREESFVVVYALGHERAHAAQRPPRRERPAPRRERSPSACRAWSTTKGRARALARHAVLGGAWSVLVAPVDGQAGRRSARSSSSTRSTARASTTATSRRRATRPQRLVGAPARRRRGNRKADRAAAE